MRGVSDEHLLISVLVVTTHRHNIEMITQNNIRGLKFLFCIQQKMDELQVGVVG